jgi:hypothetical protein
MIFEKVYYKQTNLTINFCNYIQHLQRWQFLGYFLALLENRLQSLLRALKIFFLFATIFTKLLAVFLLSQHHDDIDLIALPPFIIKYHVFINIKSN